MIKQLIASPSVGERMPNLTLTSSQGQRVQIEAYRHQSNLVAAFLFGAADEPNNRLLDELAKRIGDFRVEDATILAVVKAEAEGATQRQRGQSLPFPLLMAEEDGALTQAGIASEEETAALYVLDRYGQIYAVKHLPAEAAPAVVGEVVDDLIAWLRFVNVQCPECGVPEWPAA